MPLVFTCCNEKLCRIALLANEKLRVKVCRYIELFGKVLDYKALSIQHSNA